MRNDPYGWQEKIFILQKRTEWLCKQLDRCGIDFYRNPLSNIITIRSQFVPPHTVKKYGLVPDNQDAPLWYKVAVMNHVTIDKLGLPVEDLDRESNQD
jgi:hypothetical protein